MQEPRIRPVPRNAIPCSLASCATREKCGSMRIATPMIVSLCAEKKWVEGRWRQSRSPKKHERAPRCSRARPMRFSLVRRQNFPLFIAGFKSLSSPSAANKLQPAIDKYTEAIALNPTVAAYFSNRSLAYFKREFYGYAVADANSAIAIDPSFVKAYYRRAVANRALFHYQDAAKDLRAVRKTRGPRCAQF